jgi:hypothetical protein
MFFNKIKNTYKNILKITLLVYQVAMKEQAFAVSCLTFL